MTYYKPTVDERVSVWTVVHDFGSRSITLLPENVSKSQYLFI